jgi:dihydrofolate synthase / folylpolyglutamate synthase
VASRGGSILKLRYRLNRNRRFRFTGPAKHAGIRRKTAIPPPGRRIPDMSTPAESSLRREALEFLLGRIDYERNVGIPYGERQYRLDGMRDLLERIGRPDRKFPIIHVAGTKGKGSTSAMVAAGLGACGLSVGLFTSPHLERIEERFTIDGRQCSEPQLARLVDRLRPIVAAMDDELSKREPPDLGPTYFELTTAMALLHFADAGVDAAVLEVGMGGRLDSTNVCQSTVSIITSISYDHTKQLGDTLAEIAWEKAGIIKPGVPVVSGAVAPEAATVVRRVADERGCRLVELGRDFEFDYRPPQHLERAPDRGRVDFRIGRDSALRETNHVALGLAGLHQGANAALALATIDELRRLGWNLPEAAVRHGLAELHWPARVEVVARRPCVVLDAAHNVASIEALLTTLAESFGARRRILVFATTQEKDVAGMMRLLLPAFDDVVLTRYTQNPRGVPVDELRQIAQSMQPASRQTAEDPAEAWSAVHALRPDANDLVCITGSFFIAAQMRRQIESRPLVAVV